MSGLRPASNVTAYPITAQEVTVESSTLGMLVLTIIAVFGTASFCFEHLAARQPRKKKINRQIADEKKPAR
ncbi:hypothetical protein BFW87_21160 [Pseudomonas fluorescens]|uniref:Uncharacterized protein n=1 Tax=Pseudomonas fluorescens TaxID=294 RepID=A0A1T2YEX3_PSEFL|nr:hypothetical protein BFW87_21160 [Pseudomonas fluorescens]